MGRDLRSSFTPDFFVAICIATILWLLPLENR
jgi:hypothetical protein